MGEQSKVQDQSALAGARRVVEEKNERGEEPFHLLVESVEDYAIFMLDPQGRVSSWNVGAQRIKGYRAEEIIGQHFSRFYPEEDVRSGKCDRELEIAAREGRFEDESLRVRKDGSPFWANVVISRMVDREGRLIGFAKVTRDLTKRRALEEERIALVAQLRSLAARVQAAREDERSLMAREVHDVLGQALTGLKMDIAWLSRRIARVATDPAVSERVSAMADLIDGTIRSVRSIAARLRPAILDDLGLFAAIEWQAREFEVRAGVHVELECPHDDPEVLSRDAATAVFRIFQELLTNVARHANATNVAIEVRRKPDQIVLLVQDDGRGMTEAEAIGKSSLGLLGMRERAMLCGGSIDFQTGPGKGTTATLRIPAPQS